MGRWRYHMAAQQLPDVAELWCETVDYKPRDFDYSPENPAYGFEHDGNEVTSWEYWEAAKCEDCGRIFVNGVDEDGTERIEDGGEPHGEEEEECHGPVPEVEGPMMSYFLPLPSGFGPASRTSDVEDAARRLVDLPLCMVRIGEEYGLALTGGGMDLSWEICEAYMRLGFLPPVHYARDLPRMADKRLTERVAWVLDGCQRSAHVAAHWAKRTEDDVCAVRDWLRASSRGR